MALLFFVEFFASVGRIIVSDGVGAVFPFALVLKSTKPQKVKISGKIKKAKTKTKNQNQQREQKPRWGRFPRDSVLFSLRAHLRNFTEIAHIGQNERNRLLQTRFFKAGGQP